MRKATFSKLTFAGALVTAAVSWGWAAEPYPNKPVRMIIPFGAGGATDVVIRIVANKLPDALGQQVVIDNRTGAGSMIGTDIAAKSNPDGYTVLAAGSPFSIVPNLYKKVPYDAQKDFTPIMQIGSQPYGLTVHSTLPVKSKRSTAMPRPVSAALMREATSVSFEQVKQCANSAKAAGLTGGRSRRAASVAPSDPGKRTMLRLSFMETSVDRRRW